MRPLLFCLIATTLIAPVARAQSETPVMTTVVVPVVGSILGLDNVRWRTEVTLRNDMRTEANVVLTLPTTPDQSSIALPGIPPGGVVRFADIVGQAFNLDAAISPMVVLTEGQRSITIQANVYGQRGNDPIPVQPIPIDYTSSAFPLRVLHGLSFSDSFRTNIGIANLGENDAPFTLALQRVPGRNVAIARVMLPGSSLWHASVQSLLPLITSGDNFDVIIETSAPNTYVYASVIENATDAARFVAPAVH
jgi:hypothetical protein